MNNHFKALLYASFFLVVGLFGCGGSSTSTSTSPNTPACSGTVTSGILHDSSTNLPVAKGWATLETAQLSTTGSTVSFSQSQKVAIDANGAFQLCVPNIEQLTVVVIVALDSTSNTYPPFVQQISTKTNLGTIPMGGCTLTCGLDNQEQTSLPVTINGTIASAPISIAGAVEPQYPIEALDGSKAIWNLTIPLLSTVESYAFTTSASGCSDQKSFCASYAFLLPSQNAVRRVKGGYLQSAGSPVYSIMAQPVSSLVCIPPAFSAYFETDGKTLLKGYPGSQLTAQDINFSGCH
jgi:hypothetical protein